MADKKKDWPTENHDFRRTGFTLLKGDLQEPNKVTSKLNFFLDASTGTEQVVKPSIADIDADGIMDIVTLVHKTSNNDLTKMYGIEAKDPLFRKPKRKWTNPIVIQNGEDGAIYFPPTLANIDGDINKEIITGNRNGTVFVYDYSGGRITQKWNYTFESRFDGVNYRVKFNGGSAVADIDLDGDMEIIVADELDNDDDWPGKVYVLDGDDGTNQTSYIVGNGGAYASVSVANVDSDDYPEIVVPTQYGIKVLDYNKATNTLTEKCSNTHAYIWGSALIADVDYDNEYELVYVTANTPCAAGKTCTNNLYVINASSCTIEKNIALSDIPRPTPTVANLDSDANLELIISLEQSVPDGLGSIKAFDYSTGTEQWSYNAEGNLHPGFVSPNIADIDNDGNYNIILGENDGSMFIDTARQRVVPLGPKVGNVVMSSISKDHVTMLDYSSRALVLEVIDPLPDFETKLIFIASIFIGDNKISRNLLSYYKDLALNTSSDINLSGVNVNEVHLFNANALTIFGFNFIDNDVLVPFSDQEEIASRLFVPVFNNTISNKHHSNIKDEGTLKQTIKGELS